MQPVECDGNHKKRPVLSVFVVLIFIHSFTSPVCITLMPWEVETTWANTQSMPDYALCISRKHFHSTLCYKHTLTYPITTVHIWNDGVVRIASQLTENNHLAARYCTNSKKSVDSYKLNLQVPWPIETLFRTVYSWPDISSRHTSQDFRMQRQTLLQLFHRTMSFLIPPVPCFLSGSCHIQSLRCNDGTLSKVFKSNISWYLDLFCCSSSVFFL